MNCPKCGQNGKGVVRTTGSFYDEKNSEFYRKCTCSKCKAQFFTIEYEIEYSDDLEKKCTPLPKNNNERVQSSRERFDKYRAAQKELRKNTGRAEK
jgi:transcriptional regulator NrdR family protein